MNTTSENVSAEISVISAELKQMFVIFFMLNNFRAPSILSRIYTLFFALFVHPESEEANSQYFFLFKKSTIEKRRKKIVN